MSQNLARSRLLWVLRPVLGLGILLFLLHPSTALQEYLRRESLMAFLLGAFFGIAVFWPVFQYYLIDRLKMDERHQKNRVPDEFYWGFKAKTLFEPK